MKEKTWVVDVTLSEVLRRAKKAMRERCLFCDKMRWSNKTMMLGAFIQCGYCGNTINLITYEEQKAGHWR